MTELHIIHVLGETQIQYAVDMCVRAFQGDVAFGCLVGGDERLKGPLFEAIIRAAVVEGVIFAAVNSQDDVVGLSVWFGPGHELFGSAEQRAVGFNDVFERLPDSTKDWWEKYYSPKLTTFLKASLGPQGKINSWYASIVAVDPQSQQRGIGTMLVELAYQKAVETKSFLALCAASELNATIYHAIGFVTVGKTSMSGVAGSFPVYCLARYPPSEHV